MDEETYQKIKESLRLAAMMYPNCRVASCDCNSKAGEWKIDCHCSCHWWEMPGGVHGDWTLKEVEEEAKKGRTI